MLNPYWHSRNFWNLESSFAIFLLVRRIYSATGSWTNVTKRGPQDLEQMLRFDLKKFQTFILSCSSFFRFRYFLIKLFYRSIANYTAETMAPSRSLGPRSKKSVQGRSVFPFICPRIPQDHDLNRSGEPYCFLSLVAATYFYN